jgi:hypothetical protein
MLNEDLSMQLLRAHQKLEVLQSAQAPKMRQIGQRDSKNYETQILDFYQK